MNHINSIGANTASIILSICNSYHISNHSNLAELRFSSNHNDNDNKTTHKYNEIIHWYRRIYKSIKFILSILGVKEIAMIFITTTTLVLRSLLHLRLLYVSTRIENSVILKNEHSFWKSLSDFALYIIPTSLLFASYNYCLSELAINIRTNVSKALIKKFTTHTVYYQVINSNQIQSILGKNNIDQDTSTTTIIDSIDMNNIKSFDNPDQILTNDIEHFSYALTGLFSHVLRPIVDILVNAERLYITSGALIPTIMSIYLIISSSFLNYLRIPITEFTDSEQNLEGEYRSLIAKLSNSAEEIASLDGGTHEEASILQSLHSLINYSRSFSQFRCNMSFLDSMVARYWLMLLGWRIVGQHFFNSNKIQSLNTNINNSNTSSNYNNNNNNNNTEELYSDYQNMSKTMVALSSAVGSLIMSGKDIVKVFAYSDKLAQFQDLMNALILKHEENVYINRRNVSDLDKNYRTTYLCLQDVTICIPNSKSILHSSLDITFQRGMHTIITGENGSGKSSLLRVLAGLWPVSKGIVIRPIATNNNNNNNYNNNNTANTNNISTTSNKNKNHCILYLPQKPYMPYGSLRQQITYPDITNDDIDNNNSNNNTLLIQLLNQVELGYLINPPMQLSNNNNNNPKSFKLDTIVDWNEVLSGGEKQRLSLARVLYHKPMFALLDECTSAVSPEIEQTLYKTCMKELSNITTFISISHRPQLKQFHKYELVLTRENTHNFSMISTLETRDLYKPEISGEI